MVIVLVSLVLYTVLGGADFGAGFWQLLAGRGEHGRRIRDHADYANAPVWEANHVWLILAITVLWTGYPTVFGFMLGTVIGGIASGRVRSAMPSATRSPAGSTRPRS